MTFEEVLHCTPALQEYVRDMPEDIRRACTVRVYPPHALIHQKDTPLDRFGIVCRGEYRVINEFENGNIFMIEKNEAVSFIGEVTILAGQERTSVTIETLTECVVAFMSIPDFERWIARDIGFLRKVSEKIAQKLYRSSYNQGARLFYSSGYLVLKYVLDYAHRERIAQKDGVVLRKTRNQLYEELGMTVKTLNRTINRLKEEGLVHIEKGKIAMTRGQYDLARERIGNYMQQGKKGTF